MPLTNDLTTKLKVSTNGTLSFSAARKSHQGRYTCRALNQVGQDLTTSISITVQGFIPVTLMLNMQICEIYEILLLLQQPARASARVRHASRSSERASLPSSVAWPATGRCTSPGDAVPPLPARCSPLITGQLLMFIKTLKAEILLDFSLWGVFIVPRFISSHLRPVRHLLSNYFKSYSQNTKKDILVADFRPFLHFKNSYLLNRCFKMQNILRIFWL